MQLILRSPLHGTISKNLTLITFTGRVSGKTYTTPVSYSQEEGQVNIFTHANWWKNLLGGAPVSLHLQGQEIRGQAEPIVDDKQTIGSGLMTHLQKSPFDARFYNVTIDEHGIPNPQDVEQAVKTVVLLRVQLY